MARPTQKEYDAAMSRIERLETILELEQGRADRAVKALRELYHVADIPDDDGSGDALALDKEIVSLLGYAD